MRTPMTCLAPVAASRTPTVSRASIILRAWSSSSLVCSTESPMSLARCRVSTHSCNVGCVVHHSATSSHVHSFDGGRRRAHAARQGSPAGPHRAATISRAAAPADDTGNSSSFDDLVAKWFNRALVHHAHRVGGHEDAHTDAAQGPSRS